VSWILSRNARKSWTRGSTRSETVTKTMRRSRARSEQRDVQERLRVYERDALEAEAERQLWPIVDEAIRQGIAR
jgi:hypothetical protein